ncbi:hypothetical protein [Dactylosporangium sp. NPDC051484]|uniref:hypothetical protein n=1 Tax=Dactylosporangium sp. NPDC051484 TaxID=3154942 RepID=UPI00344F5D47
MTASPADISSATLWQDLTHVLTPASPGWAHPGMAYDDGTFLTTDALEPRVIAFDPTGTALWSVAVPAREVHGIAVDGDTLWLADPGNKQCRGDDGNYTTHVAGDGGQVLAIGRDGHVRARIGRPDLPIYREKVFRPTSVVAADDIWVADGYGADLVHRYSRSGTLLGTIGLGDVDLDNPHSIAWDGRRAGRLLIADRGHSRILALDPRSADVVAVIGQGEVDRPSGMTVWRDHLVVADLHGRVLVFDAQDRLVANLGAADSAVLDREGWPNAVREGVTVRPDLSPGAFNAPHDVAVSPDGTLVVCEWMVGGRLTALDLRALLATPANPATITPERQPGP